MTKSNTKTSHAIHPKRAEMSSTNKSVKNNFDLTPYNSTTEWRRIELPYRRLVKEPEGYMFMAILITMLAIPLNFFLIIQILR